MVIRTKQLIAFVLSISVWMIHIHDRIICML